MALAIFFGLLFFVLVGRLFQLQVLEYQTYRVLASDQHEIQAAIIPKRGELLVQDRFDGKLYPIVKDRDAWSVYSVSREMEHPDQVAQELAPLLGLEPGELTARFASNTTYTVLAKDVAQATVDAVKAKHLPGIGLAKRQARFYPEEGLGGQLFGFVSSDDGRIRSGKYGIEGFYDELLAGTYGSLKAEKDATGRRLTIGSVALEEAKDGSDLVLTIDRAIQYAACEQIAKATREFEAQGGTIIVMEPDTGAILGMCSAPDFDPADYGNISDISVLNNPATFYEFEPGSIFKPVTLAAGIDAEKIVPQTTYNDTGEEKIDGFTIRNSDKQAHGIQSMSDVLTKSLNTGTIFVQRLLGRDLFRDYVQKFGFGVKTEIDVRSEGAGNIRPLERKGQVFAATASYGQGITTTPIQMAAAYAALANGGHLVKPHVVKAVRHPDGRLEDKAPAPGPAVVSARASRLITGMMVNVVEHGHGKRAGVPGYYVAGKTGTAQVARDDGQGYLENATIGSFAGYAPADDPQFVMLVKIDRPKTVQFAESSAAPVFGEMAAFLLSYLRVKPDRPITAKPTPPMPTLPTATTTQ
jgi:cell division protein FtsI/penicillin-binding protein 2